MSAVHPVQQLAAAEAAIITAIDDATAKLEQIGKGAVEAALARLQRAALDAADRLAGIDRATRNMIAEVLADIQYVSESMNPPIEAPEPTEDDDPPFDPDPAPAPIEPQFHTGHITPPANAPAEAHDEPQLQPAQEADDERETVPMGTSGPQMNGRHKKQKIRVPRPLPYRGQGIRPGDGPSGPQPDDAA